MVDAFLGPASEVTPVDDHDDEGCESQLDEQTNSFFITAKSCSAPFILASLIGVFKIFVFVLALLSVKDEVRVVATDFFVAAAQVISILISAMTQDDVTNGIKLLDEGYYPLKDHFKRPDGETGTDQSRTSNRDQLTANGSGQPEPQEQQPQEPTRSSSVPLGYVKKWKWTLAVLTHLLEGGFGLAVTYIFIVRSSTVLVGLPRGAIL